MNCSRAHSRELIAPSTPVFRATLLGWECRVLYISRARFEWRGANYFLVIIESWLCSHIWLTFLPEVNVARLLIFLLSLRAVNFLNNYYFNEEYGLNVHRIRRGKWLQFLIFKGKFIRSGVMPMRTIETGASVSQFSAWERRDYVNLVSRLFQLSIMRTLLSFIRSNRRVRPLGSTMRRCIRCPCARTECSIYMAFVSSFLPSASRAHVALSSRARCIGA
jgi:hypothetical protein